MTYFAIGCLPTLKRPYKYYDTQKDYAGDRGLQVVCLLYKVPFPLPSVTDAENMPREKAISKDLKQAICNVSAFLVTMSVYCKEGIGKMVVLHLNMFFSM